MKWIKSCLTERVALNHILERVIRLTVVTSSMISIGTYALQVLVGKETESNYLLMEFTDDTKLGDIMNSKKVEQENLSAEDTEILWNIVFYSHLC